MSTMWIHSAFLAALVAVAATSPLPAIEPVIIAEGSAPQAPQQPQVAIDRAGRIHLTYAVGDQVFYTSSRDRGKTFVQGVKLPPAYDISLGYAPRTPHRGDERICLHIRDWWAPG